MSDASELRVSLQTNVVARAWGAVCLGQDRNLHFFLVVTAVVLRIGQTMQRTCLLGWFGEWIQPNWKEDGWKTTFIGMVYFQNYVPLWGVDEFSFVPSFFWKEVPALILEVWVWCSGLGLGPGNFHFLLLQKRPEAFEGTDVALPEYQLLAQVWSWWIRHSMVSCLWYAVKTLGIWSLTIFSSVQSRPDCRLIVLKWLMCFSPPLSKKVSHASFSHWCTW